LQPKMPSELWCSTFAWRDVRADCEVRNGRQMIHHPLVTYITLTFVEERLARYPLWIPYGHLEYRPAFDTLQIQTYSDCAPAGFRIIRWACFCWRSSWSALAAVIPVGIVQQVYCILHRSQSNHFKCRHNVNNNNKINTNCQQTGKSRWCLFSTTKRATTVLLLTLYLSLCVLLLGVTALGPTS